MVRCKNFKKVTYLYFIKNYKPLRIARVLNIPYFKIEYWMNTEQFQKLRKQVTKIPDNYSLWLNDVINKNLSKNKSRQQKKNIPFKNAS